ncbi:MAG: hypothetical protein RL014_2724 [Pseudomonadota bacterium]|jgi:rhamnosyl/mannosyltransferase
MRILHVYKSYYPDKLGGVEQVILQLTRGLHALGIESRVFTLSENADPPIIVRPEAVVVRSRTTLEWASTPFSMSAFGAFRQQLKWADVVHYQFPWPFADVLHLLAARDKPSVVSYQSDIVRQKRLLSAYSPLMNRFLRSADAIVATSPNYLYSSPVLQRLKCDVQVIPNGIHGSDSDGNDRERIGFWRHHLGPDFFLFVGVLRYYKGLKDLVRASCGLPVPVVIAGDGPESSDLKKLASSLPGANVRFLGQVSDEDKKILLQMCRAFVFPSNLRSEAFGMSLVEASMYGRALISCEIGTGTSFVNLDGVTGHVVPPGQPLALRQAMEHLHDHPEEALRMGRAARDRFESYFSAEQMARAYSALYERLVTPGAKCRPQLPPT